MHTIPAILKLDAGGLPVGWIRWQTAVVLYARDRVRWEAGEERFEIRGGTCALTGRQSKIEIGSIIAVSDRSKRFERGVPLLTNRTLFHRDQNLCLYCGHHFAVSQLTRDHVIPAARGGLTIWENCVTACYHLLVGMYTYIRKSHVTTAISTAGAGVYAEVLSKVNMVIEMFTSGDARCLWSFQRGRL